MNDFNSETMLLNLVTGLENDPAFMAHVLARYCQIEGLDKEALAGKIGIPLSLFARLALCKRPDADSPNFINEINEIADFVPMNEMKLVQIIRTVDSLTALGNAEINHETEKSELFNAYLAGILAAARDYDDEEISEITKDKDE